MKSHFFEKLRAYTEDSSIPPKYQEIIRHFYENYEQAIRIDHDSQSNYQALFACYLDLIRNQCVNPYPFAPYHKRILSPFDYYQFGIDMIKPLVDMSQSSVKGTDHLAKITQLLDKGDNVVFFANHQTEADPCAISILLEEQFPKLGENMIYVAGERVITDPLAAPFSLGRNLLCIYSKRHINTPPEHKENKQRHNKRTMELMRELLSEGGKAIYVAPSGGRDRPNAQGDFEVAPFDPQSIEMFYLMSQRAAKPTHFHPLSLKTYELLPPPEVVETELGEHRITKRAGIHLCFGQEIDMDHFANSGLDKHGRRQARADYIWQFVHDTYSKFPL